MSSVEVQAPDMTGPVDRYCSLVKAGDLRHDPVQEDAAGALHALHDRLKGYKPGNSRGFLGLFNGRDKPAPRGLYIHGGVGTGKSLLMDLFFADAPLRKKRRVHFHAFMLEIHDAIAAWRKLDQRSRTKQANFVKEAGDDPIAPVARGVAQQAHLLCFDELQVTDIADAMILSRLFTALFSEGVIVVCTSNRAPDALYQGGLNRPLFLPFIELVHQELDIFELDGGTDYRLERLKGHPVYFHPLNGEADKEMDATWEALTDCKTGKPETLHVKSRKLKVPQAARGAARFNFPDLAEKPLGAADYLTVATTYHTVFIDHIPKLGPAKRNEAKRFVTLVDALYENCTKLICSADAPPDELYPAGDGSFEFARTASRLHEMQSAEYLARGHCDEGHRRRLESETTATLALQES